MEKMQEYWILDQAPREKSLRDSLFNMYKCLKPNGILIIRDFVRPHPNKDVQLLHNKPDIIDGFDFISYTNMIKNDLYKSAISNVKEFDDHYLYETDLSTSYEYIFRKDYTNNWVPELYERYGFWSRDEAINLLTSIGYEIKDLRLIDNDWITKNRINEKISLMDMENNIIPMVKYQMVIMCRK